MRHIMETIRKGLADAHVEPIEDGTGAAARYRFRTDHGYADLLLVSIAGHWYIAYGANNGHGTTGVGIKNAEPLDAGNIRDIALSLKN